MRLLLVENSKTMASLLLSEFEKIENLEVDWADCMHKAESLLQQAEEPYGLALTCLILPDADDDKIIRLITGYQVPTIIFSATFDNKIRNSLINIPGVVDYVVKESPATLRYLSNMVHRLMNNRLITALVVDDSRVMRRHVGALLRQYQFKVLEAGNGQEALEILRRNRDIKLVVTDYNMEPIDGFQLTKKIRETWEKEELAIIGLSAVDSTTLSARFIKIGANDFITKPFQPEEFFCRVSQNMDLIEKTQALQDAAMKDFLTGLYNRRFFFEKGQRQLDCARCEGKPIALAMLDIDHFKSVNDTFGHHVGDEVLQTIAMLICEIAPEQALIARMGGEEFCILLDGLDGDELRELFEKMRVAIQRNEFASLQERKFVTTSFGVVEDDSSSLDALVRKADELLYDSKETGRNKVTFGE